MQFETTVASIRQMTPSVKSLVLDCGSDKFSFFPGQWVDIHRTINDESHNCGYSITSIPRASNTIEIAVKLAPDLLLTKYLHDDCKPGDKLFISKAQGTIFIDNEIQGPYVFIGGGVGITPLYSMINQILHVKPKTSVTLLSSITRSEEFLFQEELIQLEKTHKNFSCFATVTREKQHNQKFSGRISEQILKSINIPPHASYYLCGPPLMVDTVAVLLSQMKDELQLDVDKIFYDKWWA